MKTRTKIFSFVMALVLLLTAVVPGFTQNAINSEADAAALPTGTFKVVYAGNVNIRNGPNTSASVLSCGYTGCVLRVAGTVTGTSVNGDTTWYRVYYTGHDGSGITYGFVARGVVGTAEDAYLAGITKVTSCVFKRSDDSADTAYLCGSISSPLTGWYPYYMTNDNVGFVALRPSRTSAISGYDGAPCAVGYPVGVGASGTYSTVYFKKGTGSNNFSNLASRDTTSATVGNWTVSIKKDATDVYRRYYPSAIVGANGFYPVNSSYPSNKRVYNSADAKWWYCVNVGSTSSPVYYWVRSDYCTVT